MNGRCIEHTNGMPDSQESPLEFPCEFPIKAMGASIPELSQRVLEIAKRHAPDTHADRLTTRHSRNGRYQSVTVTVHATSRAQLDAIYHELTACELVLYAL